MPKPMPEPMPEPMPKPVHPGPGPVQYLWAKLDIIATTIVYMNGNHATSLKSQATFHPMHEPMSDDTAERINKPKLMR